MNINRVRKIEPRKARHRANSLGQDWKLIVCRAATLCSSAWRHPSTLACNGMNHSCDSCGGQDRVYQDAYTSYYYTSSYSLSSPHWLFPYMGSRRSSVSAAL